MYLSRFVWSARPRAEVPKKKEEVRFKGVRIVKDFENSKIRYYMSWQDETYACRRHWCNVMGEDPDETLSTIKRSITEKLRQGYTA